MNESAKIILPLPMEILSPNVAYASYGGRMKKASATKKYRRITCEAMLEERIDTAPWDFVEVSAVFFFKDKRRRDPDNAQAAMKAVYDGIVDSGLVIDDDWDHMRRIPPERAVDRDYPRVELTITKATRPLARMIHSR